MAPDEDEDAVEEGLGAFGIVPLRPAPDRDQRAHDLKLLERLWAEIQRLMREPG